MAKKLIKQLVFSFAISFIFILLLNLASADAPVWNFKQISTGEISSNSQKIDISPDSQYIATYSFSVSGADTTALIYIYKYIPSTDTWALSSVTNQDSGLETFKFSKNGNYLFAYSINGTSLPTTDTKVGQLTIYNFPSMTKVLNFSTGIGENSIIDTSTSLLILATANKSFAGGFVNISASNTRLYSATNFSLISRIDGYYPSSSPSGNLLAIENVSGGTIIYNITNPYLPVAIGSGSNATTASEYKKWFTDESKIILSYFNSRADVRAIPDLSIIANLNYTATRKYLIYPDNLNIVGLSGYNSGTRSPFLRTYNSLYSEIDNQFNVTTDSSSLEAYFYMSPDGNFGVISNSSLTNPRKISIFRIGNATSSSSSATNLTNEGILGGVVDTLSNIFPSATGLTSKQKFTYVLAIMLFVAIALFFVAGQRTGKVEPLMLYIIGFLELMLFFFFIAIGYIGLGILLIVIILSIVAILFGFNRARG